MKPWLYPELLFAATTLKGLQTKCLDLLHHMTNSVIKARKVDLMARNKAKERQSEEHALGNHFCFNVNC
jgi:hypothetical protein